MSGALVPSNGSPNFAQQGSVDWVSLSNSTLSFSVEMLSRFSKSGVEITTVAVGQAIFSQFRVPPEGQKRLSEAVSKLPSFSSYGKVLWFGFGIKHVFKTLCETEQGAACAAMCACLSVSYGTYFSSQVLRELSALSLTPVTLTPSLPQWAALMNVCSGAVLDSQFPALVQGFSSLIGLPSRGRESRALQEPTSAKALAGALLELSKVSNGTVNSVTFVGGADCGWIAAVAQWLFGLRLQILDHSGSQLYSNIDAQVHPEHQITVIQNFGDGSSRTETLVSSRAFLVPPGSLSFRLYHTTLLGEPPQLLFSQGRSGWSEILCDTFGSSFNDLLSRDVIPTFTTILCRMVTSRFRDEGATLRSPWEGHFCNDIPARLAAFLSAAAQQLPELRRVRRTASTDPSIFRIAGQFATLRNLNHDRYGLHDIRYFCKCNNCVQFCSHNHKGGGSPLRFDRSPDIVCLDRIVRTIFEFLWTLSWLDIHDSIRPSSSGLIMMYHTHSYEDESCHRVKTRFFERGIGVRLFSLFNGLASSNQADPGPLSAVCENGLCIYQSLILFETLPPQGLRLKILPGQIQFNERIYSHVSDPGAHEPGTFENPPSLYIDEVGINPEAELLVEETIMSDYLKVKFRLQSRLASAQYLSYRKALERTEDTHSNSIQMPNNLLFIKPGFLWRNIILRSSLSDHECSHSKVEVSFKHRIDSDPKRISTSTWAGDCSDLASMADIKGLPETNEWILVDPIQTNKYIEVVRAKFTFIYYVLCNLHVDSKVRLIRPGKCFLCNVQVLRRKSERIVVHSFLEDERATALEMFCKDVSNID